MNNAPAVTLPRKAILGLMLGIAALSLGAASAAIPVAHPATAAAR